MKRQIRRKVFETNSSSMHSLTVEKKGITEYLHVDEDENKVIVNFGEFGWDMKPIMMQKQSYHILLQCWHSTILSLLKNYMTQTNL